VQAPQHFLNIDGVGAAPDGDLRLIVARHDSSLLRIVRG
jgi:hypothetical protein